jgi:hypothetical protein
LRCSVELALPSTLRNVRHHIDLIEASLRRNVRRKAVVAVMTWCRPVELLRLLDMMSSALGGRRA